MASNSYDEPVVFSEVARGRWTVSARLSGMTSCAPFADLLKRGDYRLVAPRTRRIVVAGLPVEMDMAATPVLETCTSLINTLNAREK